MDSTLQTTTTSSVSEQKYVNLRKRLDQLGYRQTLGIESLPLIEKLFNDLVHTTESLKKAKLDKLEMSKNVDQLNTSLKNTSSTGGDLLPPTIQAYKSDNAKLIKENNELHLELIKSKDEFETQLKDLKANLRKIEHENSDLRFLNTQYIHKLRSIEKESKDKSKKILELQEKNFQAVIQTPNATKQPFTFRRQRLDIDCMLPAPSPAAINAAAPSANDPYVIDMIKLADERMAQMLAELEASKQAQEMLENKVASFKSQVENRDREVERLNRLLDGGRSCDIVTLEANLRNNEKLIAHQNFQIEILQEKNHQLERRLQEFLDTKREVINEKHKNEDLQRDLKEYNRMAKKAEMEKQLVVNAADRELDQAKYEIERSRDEMNAMESAIKQLENQKRSLCDELQNLKLELENKNCEISRLHDIVDKIQDDKSKLSKKITKYLENEKELVQELDYLKNCANKRSSGSSLTRSNSQKSLTAKLDSHIKNIENERDFFKQEVDTLQRLLKASNHEHQLRASRSVSRHASPCQNIVATCTSTTTTSPAARRSSFNHKSRRDTNVIVSTSRSPSRTKRTKSTSPCRGGLVVGTTTTTTSRPTSSTRCTVCACKSTGSPIRSSVYKITTSTSPLRGYTDEAKQLRRERDELQALLDKFERHMAEIQANVKVLTSERDKISQLYDETREELHCVRKELLKCAKSSNVSLAAQAVLKRVETERDTAIYDLRNVCNERDTYKDRLRVTSENAIKEKLCLEQQIEDLQSCLRNSELEKKEICQQINSLQNQLEDIESKYHAQNYQLAQVSQELNEQKSAANQLRILAEESDRALEEQRRQFVLKCEELHKAVQDNYRLEQKLNDMQEMNRACKEEISNLRITVNTLDKEKDKLLMSVDEKTVENVTLKQELAMKHRRIDELNNQLSQLDAALDRANDELKAKLKEITSLRIHVDRGNEEIGELSRKLDSHMRENKRLQDDLLTATRENQVLHSELDKCNGDKDHLKEQLQDYINEVTKFEELVNQKEKDRSTILEQYRDTTNELNNIKMSLNSLENEASNLKIELQMKHADNKRLREKIESLEKQTHHQMSINQELEVKLSGANRNAQRLEEALRDSQKENQEMLQDILHLRELNSRLDQCKEDLGRQLTSKELDLEQMQNDLNDKRAETELLKSHIHSERTMVKNLEELIASNREKDFQNQLSNQERDAEIQLLKDRIHLNDQNLQSRNKEVSALRTKLVEYEGEIERLRRQLTNERFERERAAQELRKLNDCELASARYIRSKSPIRTITMPGCSSSGGSSAAAVAAAAAAVAASNAAAIASGYRSLSPARSLSPCKEHGGIHITTSSSSSNSLRYSSSERRNSSPCRAVNQSN